MSIHFGAYPDMTESPSTKILVISLLPSTIRIRLFSFTFSLLAINFKVLTLLYAYLSQNDIG
uniref:Uncharacterized protein n=1 Tax=uncultured marine virus TaxID=186617 RepID=A0A0F7L4E4_9VIRU|nr:hypothetical protein [uncultured marine virus]